MGIVQGLTEFLPISSSGHLIIVPYLLGWTDPFITSLAFSVMLHVGTLAALLVYFRADWVAARAGRLRDDPRSLVRGRPGPSRSPGCSSPRPIPAAIAGVPPQRRRSRTAVREVGLVAVMLVVGAVDPVARRPLGRRARGRR